MQNIRQNAWVYWSEQARPGIEFGYVYGDQTPAVKAHFHEDDQFTFVLSGSRQFWVGAQLYQINAGYCLYIPAGIAHQALQTMQSGTRGLNVYAPALAKCLPQVISLGRYSLSDCTPVELFDLARQRLLQITDEEKAIPLIATRSLALLEAGPISTFAEQLGMRREVFSRKFSREYGMPPHAYRLNLRLNAARRQLHSRLKLVDIAAETDFSDQSHFNRHFRQTFGISPGRYKEFLRVSQTFHTRLMGKA